jgi:hypothetical protein
LANCPLRLLERPAPGSLDLKKALRAPAPLGRRVARERFDITLRKEPIEGCIDGTDRDIAADALLDLSTHSHAIRVVIQSQHREQNDLLERAQQVSLSCHLFYILEQMTNRQERVTSGVGSMRHTERLGFAGIVLLLMPTTHAEPFIIDSDLADSYHFVDSYEIVIDRPAADVWPTLIDQTAWLNAEMTHESGPRNAEGEVLRLYPGQEFFVEIIELMPNRMFAVANLPSDIDGEKSVGIAMMTLTDVDGATLVSIFMARHYYWTGDGANPVRARRESAEFRELNRATWEDQLLPRLRDVVEGGPRLE